MFRLGVRTNQTQDWHLPGAINPECRFLLCPQSKALPVLQFLPWKTRMWVGTLLSPPASLSWPSVYSAMSWGTGKWATSEDNWSKVPDPCPSGAEPTTTSPWLLCGQGKTVQKQGWTLKGQSTHGWVKDSALALWKDPVLCALSMVESTPSLHHKR